MSKILGKLALDAMYGRVSNGQGTCFSQHEGEEKLRQAILDAVGGEWNFKAFRANKPAFFAVLEEVLTLPVGTVVDGMFDNIVETEHIGIDDKAVFHVEDPSLFKVSLISAGNADLRRQKVYGDTVDVKTDWYGIKIYEEFDRFMAGRVDFAKLIEKVKTSFQKHISTQIYKGIVGSYDTLTTGKFAVTMSGSFDEQKLVEMISRVEAKTGMKCAIYGTKVALAEVSSGVTQTSDKMKDEVNSIGYHQNFHSTPMIELPTILDEADDFITNHKTLFILPIGLKLIKVVFAGEPYVDDSNTTGGNRRNDKQIEFTFEQNFGMAMLKANFYGICKLA